jgi:hypothetical protein
MMCLKSWQPRTVHTATVRWLDIQSALLGVRDGLARRAILCSVSATLY